MNEILLKMIENMISHFWIITLTLIGTSLLKKVLYMYIELQKIKIENKDTIKIGYTSDSKMVEITSSNLKIKDLKKLKEENILDYTDKAS
jgi:hypothetical protein